MNAMNAMIRNATALAVLALAGPAGAGVIYSNFQDRAIPTNFAGEYIDIDGGGWDLNPFFGGVGVANAAGFQPARIGTLNTDALANFAAGANIDAVGEQYATGYGLSQTHLGSTFTAGTEGYIGFKLGSNYGWMRVVLTANTPGAVVKDWAYDNSGASITVGRVQQSAASGGAQLVTLSPATSAENFALDSLLTDTGGNVNSLLKTGVGRVTLANAGNNYTGGTTVAAGTLVIGSGGGINGTSFITVGAGATLLNNSSTTLNVNGPVTLEGSPGNPAVLGGNGTIHATGGVLLDSLNDVLSPGASPGILGFDGDQSWVSYTYAWEINDWMATDGDNILGDKFDRIQIDGGLTLGAGGFQLNLLSLAAGNLPGEVPNFSEIARSWTILTTTSGITGFNPGLWTINTAGFSSNPAFNPANFALGVSGGNNLVLSYSVAAIPEPITWLPGILLLSGLCLRHRKGAPPFFPTN